MVRRAGHRLGRRGSMYIAVLGVSAVVTAMALGAFLAVRVQASAETALTTSLKARMNAEAGVELLAHDMSSNSAWRSRAQGSWLVNVPLADGAVTVDATDPVDGNFATGSADSVLVRSRGLSGSATHILQVELEPVGTPIPALRMAVHTPGQLRVYATGNLGVAGAPASSNGTIQVDGQVRGDVECLLLVGTKVTGSVTLLAPAKSAPDSSVFSRYTAMGTVISPGSTMTNGVLTPAYNTWGSPNAAGVYVINTTGNVTIKGVRVEGTLVINTSGTVTIDSAVFMQPARPDYPVLLINGNAAFKCDPSKALQESSYTNFNPTGAPWPLSGGSTDGDTSDTYPNELRGLVHVRGTLAMEGIRVKGVVLADSNAGSDAISVKDVNDVEYDPAIWATPPLGYTSDERVRIKPGTWRQVVLP